MRHPPSIVRGKSMRRTQRSSQRSAVSADSRQTGQTSVDTEQAGAEDQAAKSRGGSKKSANLVIDLENIKVNGNSSAQSGQYLETPKQSPDVEPPRPSIVTEGEGKQEKQERMSARDRFGHNYLFNRSYQTSTRWARGKAIIRGEIESQKSGGSSGSGGAHVARGQNQRVGQDDGSYDDQSYYEVEYYYDDSDEDNDVDYSRKPVPILLSIILVVTYIIGGAFLFQMWEGWTFLDSSYFCFITLTTIGFGDLTPDQRNTADGEQRIALCSLYLLFGIAMIAMSFNLLQEEVINSVKSLGKMCGIIKDNEEEEEY